MKNWIIIILLLVIFYLLGIRICRGEMALNEWASQKDVTSSQVVHQKVMEVSKLTNKV